LVALYRKVKTVELRVNEYEVAGAFDRLTKLVDDLMERSMTLPRNTKRRREKTARIDGHEGYYDGDGGYYDGHSSQPSGIDNLKYIWRDILRSIKYSMRDLERFVERDLPYICRDIEYAIKAEIY